MKNIYRNFIRGLEDNLGLQRRLRSFKTPEYTIYKENKPIKKLVIKTDKWYDNVDWTIGVISHQVGNVLFVDTCHGTVQTKKDGVKYIPEHDSKWLSERMER